LIGVGKTSELLLNRWWSAHPKALGEYREQERMDEMTYGTLCAATCEELHKGIWLLESKCAAGKRRVLPLGTRTRTQKRLNRFMSITFSMKQKPRYFA
jgi:hypothetical protein